ncbi:MAG: TRAP transporter substrate-binding protein, partial [Rhodospirillales bacterium]|nr:TRAP transporter substrate-binding protein [Rhodospirillales bacterium]
QVRDGVIDIAWTLPGFTPGRMPKIEVFELPFMHRHAVSTNMALQDYQDKYLAEELKDYKVLLTNVPDGFLLMTKKPVRSLADFKGRKWRSANRAGVWMLGALGATPVGLPLPRLPSSIAKGVITGSLLPFEIAPAVKMHELVSNFTQLSGDQPRFGTVVFTFLMNKKSYAKLPPDLKRVIDSNSGRHIARKAGLTWIKIEKSGEKVVRSKKKNKLSKLNAAETAKIKKAVQPVFDRWFAEMKKIGVDGPALLADARAMLHKHRPIK